MYSLIQSFKTIIMPVVLCVAILFTVATPGEAEESKKAYNLRMQSLYGSNMVKQLEPMIEFVREASNGRLNIEVFSSDQLVPNNQILDAVGEGTIDMGNGNGGYWGNVIPIANIESGLPFAFDNWTDVNTFFYQRGFLELCREEYAKQGVYYLGPRTVDMTYMQTKEPVKTLNDLQEQKIRATSNMAKVLEDLGVAATYISPTELYMALSTGTIDGVVYGGAFTNWALSIQEGTNYYLTPSVFASVEQLMINKELWDSLPKDLQAILELAVVYDSNYARTDDWNKEYEYRNKMVEEHDIEIMKMNDSLVNNMLKSSKKTWDEIAEKDEAAAKGIKMMKNYLREIGKID